MLCQDCSGYPLPLANTAVEYSYKIDEGQDHS